MTDTPVRKIIGLTPRRDSSAPLARLMKSERDRTPLQEPVSQLTAPEASDTSDPAAVPTPSPRASRPAAAEDRKETLTLRWSAELRNRSRATFLATRYAEKDETYSEMVAKAVEAELRRREAIYNNGQPFTGGEAQLPSGRPFVG